MITKEGSSLPRLFLILPAIKKTRIPLNRLRLPITYDILLKLCVAVANTIYSPFVKAVRCTAFITAFYGFLRCGELTVMDSFDPYSHLCVGDITFHDPHYVVVKLKTSKTDPGRQGVSILLFANNLMVCPYKALATYISIRLSQGALSMDPLLSQMTTLL